MGSIVAPAALENVLYDKRDGVAYVTVNRPKVLKTLNGKTVAQLTVFFEQAGKDSSLQGVILTGAGSKLSSQVRTSANSPVSRLLKLRSLAKARRQSSISSRTWGNR